MNGEKFKYLDRIPSYTELEPHYFEVDFSKGETEALRILEKVVGLSMSFATQPSFKDFLFIVKGIDQSGKYHDWEHQGMICGFNGRKFFMDTELFSPRKYTTTKDTYEYNQVVIKSMEGIFNLERANKLWSIYSFYIPFNVDRHDFNEIFNVRNSFYL